MIALQTLPFRRYSLLALLFSCLFLSSYAVDRNESSVERMKKDIFFLAGEECEGRGVETQGIQKAADYIAHDSRNWG